MIPSDRYKRIVDLINDAQARGEDITTHLDNMLTILSSSEILSSSTDRQRLEDQINATKDVGINYHQSYSRQMRDFVFALQKFIDNNYLTVNDFLSDNNIMVYPTFASISDAVGYTIDNEHIINIS